MWLLSPLTDVDEHTITRQYTYTMGDVLGNEPVRVNATFLPITALN